MRRLLITSFLASEADVFRRAARSRERERAPNRSTFLSLCVPTCRDDS